MRGWIIGTILFCAAIGAAHAQPDRAVQQTAPQALQIKADSPPYHLEWNGNQGSLTQSAFGNVPEQKYTLEYLHTDPGPSGFSQHLAWFLGRSAHGFAVIWSYMNDDGNQFWCWLYRYPENLLTTQRFVGDYRFAMPPVATDKSFPGFDLPTPPPYNGPNFTYANWTAKSGGIPKLDLYPSITTENFSATVVRPSSDALKTHKPERTLEGLTVYPLHQLQVGGANGWRIGGWEELHALAYDAAKDPYYLILYTNSTLGFVIDLNHARTYTADFGSKVVFQDDQPAYGPDGKPSTHVEIPQIHRNERYEIELKSTKTYDMPYVQVLLDLELHSPVGKTVRVPGFWDGENTWRIRFAPPQVGTWTWKTVSTDKDLDGKTGTLECVSESDPTAGFLHVHPYRSYRHHFVVGQTTPIYPTFFYDPVQYDPAFAATGGTTPGARAVSDTAPANGNRLPESFVAFQGRMDAIAANGFNRVTGGYVLQGDSQTSDPSNEGGTAFINHDLLHLNPAYFQWMDKRIAYCNGLGIVPDVGLARSPVGAFSNYNEGQLRTLWRYLLARYASYDVCWNLFGPAPADNYDLLSKFDSFADLNHKYDLFGHPLTTVLIPPGQVAGAAPTKPTAPNGKPGNNIAPGPPPTETGLPDWLDVITLQGGDPSMITNLLPLQKPIVYMAPPAKSGTTAPDPETLLTQIWAVRMRDGYWGGLDASAGAIAPDSPQLRPLIIYNRFFRQTRYWRMEPHPDMLGGPDETEADKRKRAELEAQAGLTGGATGTPKASDVLILADPAHEYVLYFKHGGGAVLDLLEATGHIQVNWIDPHTGISRESTQIMGGGYHAFVAPDNTKDWVLYLKRL